MASPHNSTGYSDHSSELSTSSSGESQQPVFISSGCWQDPEKPPGVNSSAYLDHNYCEHSSYCEQFEQSGKPSSSWCLTNEKPPSGRELYRQQLFQVSQNDSQCSVNEQEQSSLNSTNLDGYMCTQTSLTEDDNSILCGTGDVCCGQMWIMSYFNKSQRLTRVGNNKFIQEHKSELEETKEPYSNCSNNNNSGCNISRVSSAPSHMTSEWDTASSRDILANVRFYIPDPKKHPTSGSDCSTDSEETDDGDCILEDMEDHWQSEGLLPEEDSLHSSPSRIATPQSFRDLMSLIKACSAQVSELKYESNEAINEDYAQEREVYSTGPLAHSTPMKRPVYMQPVSRVQFEEITELWTPGSWINIY